MQKWARTATALAAAVVLTVTAGVLAGCERTSQAPPPAPAKQPVNQEQELALAFYKAVYLEQDPAAGWDMMNRVHQADWTSRERFLELHSGKRRLDTPADLQITERRRPQDRSYRYLFKSSITDPVIVEVYADETGKLTILESEYARYGGGEL